MKSPKNQSFEKVQKQKQVKAKIQQIMLSVKQEKQHIQNRLATNDRKIQNYCEQYEELMLQNDFSHLKKQEETVLLELVKGLNENGIDSRDVIGADQVGLKAFYHNNNLDQDGRQFKKLKNEQILAVQALLIDKLVKQLKKKQQK